MPTQDLKDHLDKIRRTFDTNKLLRQSIDNQTVVAYYVESDYGYRVFHSTEGCLHLALNFDGKFGLDGYYGQARIVQEHINRIRPVSVLELGSGKGFNSIYLAKQNPTTKFVGIDLTPEHVTFARARAREIANLRFEIGDFQDLSFYPETFDLVFAIDSMCYASNVSRALSEASRILKTGGYLNVIDGFRQARFNHLDSDIQLAAKLAEASMAVDHFWMIENWLGVAQKNNFSVSSFEDISEAILPNLVKLQHLAKGYFKYPILSKALLQILPVNLIKNSIAGLLMPITVRAGAHGYFSITLRRS
jgi:arsenite methyltransferase